MGMRYANVKLPASVAWLDTDEDVYKALEALVGKGCVPCGEPLGYDASIGLSSHGPWAEGDISFTKGDGRYGLAYDFMCLDNSVARVFRYDVTRFD